MSKKKKSEWEGEPAPTCPNNSRHDGMIPDANGGWICEECREVHTPRSREAYRWAFAREVTHE